MGKKTICLNKRKHTICFLEHTKSVFPVYLTAEIDMNNIVHIKNNLFNKQSGKKISFISFIIFVVSKAIARHKEANIFYRSFFKPKFIKHANINAKFTMDIKMKSERIVASAIVPNSDSLSLFEIQEWVDSFKNSDFESDKRFDAIKKLHKLPLWIGISLFKLLMNFARHNSKVLGSFTITSLGYNPVDVFMPLSGGALAFGVGQIKDRAVVKNSLLEIKPTLMLTMVFDHKILDGALASDILTEIKQALETFTL